MTQKLKQARVVLYGVLLMKIFLSGMCFAAYAEDGGTAVPFVTLRGSMMVVQVRVNGSGPYEFLLDTGATSSCIDKDLIEALQLAPSGDVEVSSTVGTALKRRVLLSRVSFGPVETGPVSAFAASLIAYKALDMQIRGVLGQDVLSQLDYLIDNRHHRIRVDTDGLLLRRLAGEHIRVESVKTRDGELETRDVFVIGVADASRAPVHLLLDSGTAHVMLRSASLKSAATPSASKWVSDDDGRFAPATVIRTRVAIGSTSFETEAWVIENLLEHVAIDGLLPTGSFESLYVANHQSFVIFNPQMRVAHHRRGSKS